MSKTLLYPGLLKKKKRKKKRKENHTHFLSICSPDRSKRPDKPLLPVHSALPCLPFDSATVNPIPHTFVHFFAVILLNPANYYLCFLPNPNLFPISLFSSLFHHIILPFTDLMLLYITARLLRHWDSRPQ